MYDLGSEERKRGGEQYLEQTEEVKSAGLGDCKWGEGEAEVPRAMGTSGGRGMRRPE